MLMSTSQRIDSFSLSDPGAKRSHNEDSVATDNRIGLVVVADGMGGYKGGEVASALAVNTITGELENFIARRKEELGNVSDHEYSPESMAVRDVLELSNEIIFNAAQSQPQYSGMGTTVVLALFYEGRMTIAHVGDSRLYRFRGDNLELITIDHTLLQELIARGFYSEEEAKESQNKNLVTRALGIESSVDIDIQEDVALPGDVYLLCSDGLNDMVEDRDIHLTLKQYNDNLDQAVAELIQLAKENGGKDNVSVVLARPTQVPSSPKSWAEKLVDWFF